MIVKTLEEAPTGGYTHWSRASMAAQSGLSKSTIGRIWKAFGLQPHRVETFKLSTDPRFEQKLADVVGRYLNPPDRAIVLCMDEKSLGGDHHLRRDPARARHRAQQRVYLSMGYAL